MTFCGHASSRRPAERSHWSDLEVAPATAILLQMIVTSLLKFGHIFRADLREVVILLFVDGRLTKHYAENTRCFSAVLCEVVI